MTQAKRSSPSGRWTPRQRRSVQTVEAIFDATATVIESPKLETLTTAPIAKLAVYGVGTSFAYFPTKNPLLSRSCRVRCKHQLPLAPFFGSWLGRYASSSRAPASHLRPLSIAATITVLTLASWSRPVAPPPRKRSANDQRGERKVARRMLLLEARSRL